MMRLWMIPALLVGFALPLKSHAVVDMKNANYADSWIDITLPGSGYDLKVQRFYNSRSVFNGMFGFGWCSDFETSLESTPEGRLKLVECGAGQEVFYSPDKYNQASLEKTIDGIIEHYKKTNRGATDDAVNTLRRQLHEYSDLRARWAKQAKIDVPDVKKGTVYSADTLGVEQIVFDGSHYTRKLSDGTSQKFDKDGRLAFVYDKNGNYLKLVWGATLKEVIDNKGRKLTFSYLPGSKRAKVVSGPNKIKTEYEYKGEDLVSVKNMWNNTYTYAYDGSHNLTRINFPDKTFKALTYNEKNDWVTSFTDRALAGNPACVETYNYEVDKENPRDHYWSTAIKKCGKEIKNEARFEFWHKKRSDGRKYLSRVLTKSLTDTLDVSYHPEFGRPTVIKKNSVTTTFDYYSNGLIREKTTANVRMVYEYKNQFNKVSQVVAEFVDAKGKVLRKRVTTFTYNKKANLVAAKNSDGQSVQLTYDARGRIASITDQAKKEVKIQYDDRLDKPSQITRPKVGTINVTYKANGEIDKVKSDDGPTVAVQVASTFNNLLDIIAPATSELNL